MASIRQNLKASAPFDADWQEHHGPSGDGNAVWAPIRTAMSTAALTEDFRTSLELLGGHCSIVADETGAAALVGKIIEKLAAKRVATSDSEIVGRIVKPSDGIEIVKNAPVDFLFDCDLGITSAQWAIAETGTLVLESDKESHRLTSLVPPVHLCMIRATDIRQTLSEILELTGRVLSRTITFITGASRTSDIELTLAIGVHGPGELHVIVIAD